MPDTTAERSVNAEASYDALAHAYDDLTAGYAHDRWLAGLERLAHRHGLRGRRVLDVACGTGKSFLPLLAGGYEVTACDISAAMLERARQKAPHARLLHADMRALPALGQFDLVTCLDDSLNYVLAEDDLRATLAGIRMNLAPDGVALWDLNTLAMYRGAFAQDCVSERDGRLLAWRGHTSPRVGEAQLAEISVEVFSLRRDGLWERSTSRHTQRHWPRVVIRRAAEAAGLHLLDVCGQLPGAVLEPALDEAVHTKAVYVARRDDRA